MIFNILALTSIIGFTPGIRKVGQNHVGQWVPPSPPSFLGLPKEVDECLVEADSRSGITECLAPVFGTSGDLAYVNQRVRALARPQRTRWPNMGRLGVPEVDECLVGADARSEYDECLAPLFGTPAECAVDDQDCLPAYVNQRVRALAMPASAIRFPSVNIGWAAGQIRKLFARNESGDVDDGDDAARLVHWRRRLI